MFSGLSLMVGCPLGRSLAGFQEDLGRPADEIEAAVAQDGRTACHLIPEAAESVVGEELDDIARGKELVADGQFPTIPWRGGFLAHLLPLSFVVVILVNPADGLVGLPDFGELLGRNGFVLGSLA